MLDVTDLKFLIGHDGKVLLCLGPVQVEVCENAEGFDGWRMWLAEQLDLIAAEMPHYFESENDHD